MEAERSLPCTQKHPTCPHLEPHESIPRQPNQFFTISHPLPGFPRGLLLLALLRPFTFHFSPTRATCSAHHILLEFITLMIFGEQYKS